MKIKHLIALAGLIVLASCSTNSTEDVGDGAVEADDESNLGNAISDTFGDLGSGDQGALALEGDVQFDICSVGDEFEGPEGISLTKEIAAGHYGSLSRGVTYDAGFTCDSSSAETAVIAWSIDTPFTFCNMEFSGNGVVTEQEVHGNFLLNGVTYLCDVSFGEGEVGADFYCEDEEGNTPSLEGHNEEACAAPEGDAPAEESPPEGDEPQTDERPAECEGLTEDQCMELMGGAA